MKGKRAEVYRRRGMLYVNAQSYTVEGFLISAPPFARVAEEDGPEALGTVVAAALQSSCEGLPQPSQKGWKDVVRPLLRLAGERSFNAFMKGTTSCGLTWRQNKICTVMPYKNEGRDGFTQLRDRAFEVEASLPHELGGAVNRGLSLCE